jgi:hypothetical protein
MNTVGPRTAGERRAFGLLLVLLALVALGTLLWRGGTVAFPDEAEYLALARTLLSTGTFGHDATTPTAYRLPLYPAFLASVLGLVDSVTAIQAVQLGLWLLTGLVLACTARSLAGVPAGLLALALWGAYPQGLFLATTLYPQALLAPALALSLHLAVGRASLPRAAALGLLGGLSTLCVANALIVALLHLGLLTSRLARRRVLPALLLGGALLALPPSLWVARNAALFDGALVLSSNSGINLLLGNAPGVTAETGTGLDLAPYAAMTRGLSELAADRVFRDHAVAWIGANPGEAARLYLDKLAHWLAASNRLATAAEEGRARTLLAALGWYGLLAALLLGTGLAARAGRLRPRLLAASWGAWLTTALLYAVFFTRVRFRVPFDALLVPVAASGLALGFGGLSGRANQGSPTASSTARATSS